MIYETQPIDPQAAVELEDGELETIATAVQVQTGIRAGRRIQPCI